MAFLTLMAAYPASSLADTQVSGIICSDTTWTSSGSPYVIDTQVQVAYGATLTIDPGVEVSGGVLGVWGTLAATNTRDAPIYLNAVSVELGSATRDEPGDIELSHCLVDGGGVGIGSGYGTLSLSDSVCVDMAQLDAYYPTSDWYLEDNVFRNCSGIWTWTNSYEPVSYGNVYILNNVFYDATAPIENVISGGTSFTQVTGNTFDPPDAGQTTIALELEPYLPNAAMEAEGNYSGTARFCGNRRSHLRRVGRPQLRRLHLVHAILDRTGPRYTCAHHRLHHGLGPGGEHRDPERLRLYRRYRGHLQRCRSVELRRR